MIEAAMINLRRYVEADVTVKLGVKSEMRIEAIDRAGRTILEGHVPNLVLNKGLEMLVHPGTRINDQLNFIVLGSGNAAAVATDDGAIMVGPLSGDVCDFDPPPIQGDTTVEGWTNNVTNTTVELLPDFSEARFIRQWVVTADNAFSNATGLPAGDRTPAVYTATPGGNADFSSLKQWGVGSDMSMITVHVVCPPDEDVFPRTFGIPALFNYGLFASPIDLGSITELRFTYTLRWFLPLAEVQHVVNISGTDYTFTTRGYKLNDPTLWDASYLGFYGSVPARHRCFETNVMPAIDGFVPGTQVIPVSLAMTTGFNGVFPWREVEMKWQASDANFATGVGGFTHLNVRTSYSEPNLVTVINPKIPKTNAHKLILRARYEMHRQGE